jgi:polysaccharide biosynthesis transport protein
MQPNDSYSVSRRPLDVEDYIDILRRHRGWIFGPFLFCVVASVVGVFLWPDSYESAAIVKIRGQQIPVDMVQSTFNQSMLDRIESMQQTIESRAVLTTIINNFGLYLRERNRMPIEDVIDEMKKAIKVEMIASKDTTNTGRATVPAFEVQFSYDDRHKAQQVVTDLVSRFTEENLRYQSNATYGTTKFMEDELDQAGKRLNAIEDKLAQFRAQHNGQLPDQMAGNYSSLQNLQSQMTMLEASVSRSNEEKLQLEGELQIVRDQVAELKKAPPVEAVQAPHRNDKLADAERDVSQLSDTVTQLRQRYSDTMPDVKIAQQRLQAAQEKRDALLKEDADEKKAEAKTDAPKALNPTVARDLNALDVKAKQLASAIEAKDLEIVDVNKQIKRVGDMTKTFTARIESVPIGEKEYEDLLREQMSAKEEYVKLQMRLGQAKMSEEMQNRNEGEGLEILDPPSLPINPSEPKRWLVISIGAGAGLLLGIVFASAREMKDSALKNLKDVRAYTQMAILGSIPLLENDFVVRRRKRLAWLGWTTACLAAVVIMSGSIVYYFTTKE